jgi:predicted DNA-binding transcriptional regulator AlpA
MTTESTKKRRKPRPPRQQTMTGSRRALRLPAVCEKTGLRRTQILDAVRRGVFPQPYHVLPDGRAQCWDEGEIDAVLLQGIAARDAAPELASATPPLRGQAFFERAALLPNPTIGRRGR